MLDTNINNNVWQKSARVKTVRALTGLSRQKFAKKFGFSPATLQLWEAPHQNSYGITRKGAERLIKALGRSGIVCTTDWIIHGKGNPPEQKRKIQQQDNKTVDFFEEKQLTSILVRSELDNIKAQLPSLDTKNHTPIFKGTFTIIPNEHYNNLIINKEIDVHTFAIIPSIVFKSKKITDSDILCEISEQIASLLVKYNLVITPSMLMKLSLEIHKQIFDTSLSKTEQIKLISPLISMLEKGMWFEKFLNKNGLTQHA